MHESKNLAPLTGVAFASNWLIKKLNLNSVSVKTTKLTTFLHAEQAWGSIINVWCPLKIIKRLHLLPNNTYG